MGVVLGYDFVLYIEKAGQQIPVCYSEDVQINRTFETKEISGPQGRARYYVYDMIGYTIQIPILVSWATPGNYLDLAEFGENGETIKWKASSYKDGGVVLSGEALLTGLNLTSQMRDMIKTDVSLIGSGPILTERLPIQTVVYLSDFDKIQLVGCPNPYPVTVFWYDHTMIGIATNADDVISIFNQYSANHGALYMLTSSVDGGCNFNMDISFTAEEPYPTTIFARPGGTFAISPDQKNNLVISPDQDADQGITPVGS